MKTTTTNTRVQSLRSLFLLVCITALVLATSKDALGGQVPSPAAAYPIPNTDTGPDAKPQASPATSDDAHSSQSKAAKEKEDDRDNDRLIDAAQLHNPVIWHDPGNISSLDLLQGPAAEQGRPQPPFTFESEDRSGTNPKFDVRDASGHKWRVKLGAEARPEVVASRLLWAVGYFVNEDYVLPSAEIEHLHIQRGANLVKSGRIVDGRFARKPDGQKKIGIWSWANNPFTGTRELNGLRVMMAVMNGWDLKDVNNAVYEDRKTRSQIFLASDIGATFGTNGLVLPISHSKGDVGSFEKSKFVQKVTDKTVDFNTPHRPNGFLLETAGAGVKQYSMRAGLDWIGNNIPREDARWIGSLLGQLSHQQLIDAFRAGDFKQEEIEVYVALVEQRIAALKGL